MKKIFFIACVFSITITAQRVPGPEAIFQQPAFYGNSPASICWSPGDSSVAFIWNKNGYRYGDIWLAQIPSGKLRQLTTFNNENYGNPDQIIGNLSWFPRRQKLLFTYRGDIYTLIPNKQDQPVALTITDSREIAPAVSPDGKYVSFIRDNTLRLIGVKEGREIQLSHTMQGNRHQRTDVYSDSGTLFHYQWSPSGRQIAIPDFVENYARAILIFNLASDNSTVRIVLSKDRQLFVRDMLWSEDEKKLVIDYMAGNLTERNIVLIDIESQQIDTLYSRQSELWCNDFGSKLFWTNQEQKILFGDTQNSYQHIFVVDLQHKTPISITRGKWTVFNYAVRAADDQVFFTANKDNHYEKHIYTIDRKNDKVVKVSYKRGCHDFALSSTGQYLIDVFSTASIPPQLYWTKTFPVSKSKPLLIPDARIPNAQHLMTALNKKIRNSKTGNDVHYTLWYPEDHLASEKYPLILFLNEAKKSVSDLYEWEFSNLIAQWLSSKGYIVAEIDYPTLPEIPEKIDADRGLEPLEMQLQDIDAVIGVLAKEEFIDVSRIGTWGFGYGGYLSLMALLREPDRFSVGVVIPSENNWERSYSIYERNIFRKIAAADYPLSLNSPDIFSNLRGKLLLIQGVTNPLAPMINAFELTRQMLNIQKRIDFIFYPWEGSQLTSDPAYIDLMHKLLEYFDRFL